MDASARLERQHFADACRMRSDQVYLESCKVFAVKFLSRKGAHSCVYAKVRLRTIGQSVDDLTCLPDARPAALSDRERRTARRKLRELLKSQGVPVQRYRGETFLPNVLSEE